MLPKPGRAYPALLIALLLLAFALPAHAYIFAIFGDNRPQYDPSEQPEVFHRIVAQVEALHPDFSVELGDKVLGHKLAFRTKAQYRQFLRVTQKLSAPLHFVVGNHDVHGPGQGLYSGFFGKRYYSFDHRGDHFIILDAYQPGAGLRIAGKQLDWLRADLKASAQARRIFVFVHPPLFPMKGHVGESLDAHPAERDALHRLFVVHHVAAVFAGHNHFYERTDRDGIAYITCGGAGAPLYASPAKGGFYHFLLVEAKGNQVSVQVRNPDGSIRFQYRLWEASRQPEAALVR